MHTDPELLSLMALGEDVGTDEERRHVQTCRQCAAELAELQQLIAVGRSVSEEITIVTPSADVWARICQELDFDVTPHSASARSADPATTADAADHQSRRSPLARIKAALTGSSPDSSDHLRAHAHLSPVEPGWSQASGTAEIATDHQGRRLLEVALHADLPTSGVRQAWLVHRDDPTKMQTLGVLDGGHGLWTVPHTIDLEEYAFLDISQQDTGQTEHSGHTLVRGQFTLVS